VGHLLSRRARPASFRTAARWQSQDLTLKPLSDAPGDRWLDIGLLGVVWLCAVAFPRRLEWLARRRPPGHLILTNRLHSRHSARLVAAVGCTVWCHRSGLYELGPELNTHPFAAAEDEFEHLLTAHGNLCLHDGRAAFRIPLS